jgi:proteasome lid subunit RPN8/RPN11
MRAVKFAPGLLEAIGRHAVATYPEESCGFLYTPAGLAEADPRPVVTVEPAPNRAEGPRERRFQILPGELREAERRGEPRRQAVVGFYHSHPDHPARPSEFDRDHAWPWYTYVVVSVAREGPGDLGAFELDPEAQEFRPVPLSVDVGAHPAPKE